MKRIFILISFIAFASCSSDDDAGNVNTNEFEHIKSTLPQGEWKISKFIDIETDKTSAFESFVFTFNEDGSVTAQNDLFTENGIWAYDNTSNNAEELVLQFSEQVPFDEINDDYDIVSVSNSTVELADESGENGEIEILTFTKL